MHQNRRFSFQSMNGPTIWYLDKTEWDIVFLNLVITQDWLIYMDEMILTLKRKNMASAAWLNMKPIRRTENGWKS